MSQPKRYDQVCEGFGQDKWQEDNFGEFMYADEAIAWQERESKKAFVRGIGVAISLASSMCEPVELIECLGGMKLQDFIDSELEGYDLDCVKAVFGETKDGGK